LTSKRAWQSVGDHLAIQEHIDGKNVDWMEMVSDEQYQAKPDGTD
jgi:hypothetical protein